MHLTPYILNPEPYTIHLTLYPAEAYDLLSDRGGQSGATFEGLGDKAKRDFVKLPGVQAGSAAPRAAALSITPHTAYPEP